MATVEERLSALETKVATLAVKVDTAESDIKEIGKDVKSLLALANRQKGGWAVIAAFSAVAGAAGGLIGMFAGKH